MVASPITEIRAGDILLNVRVLKGSYDRHSPRVAVYDRPDTTNSDRRLAMEGWLILGGPYYFTEGERYCVFENVI